MSKRRLSPASLPPPKRPHTDTSVTPRSSNILLSSFYDELMLFIFSHLSFIDLCHAQAVSLNWARLASDNQVCVVASSIMMLSTLNSNVVALESFVFKGIWKNSV